jgi:phage shock protein PspC (stress-responsive transcriptional regulator)
MLSGVMHVAAIMIGFAEILDLGEKPSSVGTTLALLITFLGIGLIANLLIAYAIAQVLAERRENQERQQRIRERG